MALTLNDDDHAIVGNGIAPVESQRSTASECRRLALGLVIVICIALSWVGAVQLTKMSYSEAFSAPLFLVWLGTSWMMTLFPVASAIYFLSAPHRRFRNPEAVIYWSGITFRSLLTSMVLFTSLWVGINYSYSRALMYASATDVATLSSSSSAFIVLLSICILKEQILILRILSVLLSCVGIVLFAYADGFQSVGAAGVLLSLVSAIGIAMYKVLLKWRVGDASIYQMTLFLSVIGAFNTVTLFPVVLLLHFTGVEILYHIPWNFVIWSSILGVIFNFLINFGIAYTYPLFISLGTLLGIPINAIIDALVHNIDLLNWKFPGAILIMSGFLILLAPPSDSLTIHKFFLKLIRWKWTS